MGTATGRRLVTLLVCAPVVSALGVARAASGSAPVAAECVKLVEESGQTTGECLAVAPDSQRVDLGTATFSKPTPITNPLHPTSEVKQVIMGGQADDKPFRTEVTLLPGTRPIVWHGKPVDTAIVQYVAYLDGRINEVAMDWFAQADDGSVWYFGEDVSNFEDGKVADTNGTWMAGDKTPAAMIMPAKPAVGDITVPRTPLASCSNRCASTGSIGLSAARAARSAAPSMSLSCTWTGRRGEVSAPGYGEFSTGAPGGDLEAVSLASPKDSRQGPAPAEFGALSGAVAEVFDAVAAANRDRAERATTALAHVWDAALTKGIPPLMESQMNRDIDALKSVLGESDWRAAESAALRVLQNELDLRLLYQPVIDVDVARLALWTHQLPVDAKAGDPGLVLADVAALDRVWERTRPRLQEPASVDAAMRRLKGAADAEDLSAVGEAAAAVDQAVAGLRVR